MSVRLYHVVSFMSKWPSVKYVIKFVKKQQI